MIPIFVASLCSPMYCADLVPCAGSEKHTRKAFFSAVQSTAEPDGEIMKRLSLAASVATAMVGAEVVGPMSICMPQSFRELNALMAFS